MRLHSCFIAIFSLLSGNLVLAANDSIELRVMSFNVWYGGDEVSLARTGEAIRAANADIVGLQESDRNLERIAVAAGMPYVDPRRRIISHWPLFDSGTGVRTEPGTSPYSTTGLDQDSLHAWVMVRPGKVVAVANVHLSNAPSGLGAARTGGTPGEVRVIENSSRVVETLPLTHLAELTKSGYPVFLTGDFNTASHLDWTAATHASRDDVPFAFDWPVTRTLADAGFRDSYREAHPDPLQSPGYTWTPGAPHPHSDHERARDRIDYVFTTGKTETLASQIVGEAGNPVVDIEISPWPSDHRGVVSTFRLEPAAAPPMISVTPRRLVENGAVQVRTWDPSGATWTAMIAPRGGSLKDALSGVHEMPHDYQRSIPMSTLGLAPGDYDAILVDESGEIIARDGFTIVADNAQPELMAVNATVAPGKPIQVRWRNAPGDLRDWVGLYRAGEVDVTRYIAFAYTEASVSGKTELLVPELEPGEYELRLLHDETYVVLAKTAITIVDQGDTQSRQRAPAGS